MEIYKKSFDKASVSSALPIFEGGNTPFQALKAFDSKFSKEISENEAFVSGLKNTLKDEVDEFKKAKIYLKIQRTEKFIQEMQKDQEIIRNKINSIPVNIKETINLLKRLKYSEVNQILYREENDFLKN